MESDGAHQKRFGISELGCYGAPQSNTPTGGDQLAIARVFAS